MFLLHKCFARSKNVIWKRTFYAKKSSVSGHRSASKIGAVTRIFFVLSPTTNYVTHAYTVIGSRSNFTYTEYGRIPIDPAILTAIGHRFIAKHRKKTKTKNADARI